MKIRMTATKIMIVIAVAFLTVLTTGCGKTAYRRIHYMDETKQTEAFCIGFFTESNLPYTRLKLLDVENTQDEYLFYIKGGFVYRTQNDYDIVITQRSNLNEEEKYREKNYSGELYRIFEDDETDLMRIAASGEYALLTLPATIPDWENDLVIQSFMKYAEKNVKSLVSE